MRIPIPYWAIAKFDDEPFLSGAQWKYIVKAIGWARKYGLRINLDLHAHPGSQNGCVFARSLSLCIAIICLNDRSWDMLLHLANAETKHRFNHAGVLNAMNWMYGTMGIANAQRSLEIVRSIAEFISQPQYTDVVVMFGLVNEPQLYKLGQDVVGHLYVFFVSHLVLPSLGCWGVYRRLWDLLGDV